MCDALIIRLHKFGGFTKNDEKILVHIDRVEQVNCFLGSFVNDQNND